MANDLPQASPSITFGRGGFVEQVTYAPSASKGGSGMAHAAARPDAVSSSAVRSMAPPAFTPDVPFSSPAAAGPVPDAATSSDLAPMIDGGYGANENGAGGKVVSHVERNRLHPSRRGGASPPVSPAAALSDAAERAVQAAESREADARESSLAYGGGSQSQSSQAFDEAACHGGPFSRAELGQLALHCTGEAGVRCDGSAPRRATTSYLGAWASLDGDLLATLAPMLQRHVKSALAIDLVGEGRGVLARSLEASGNKNKRPVITINQVGRGVRVTYSQFSNFRRAFSDQCSLVFLPCVLILDSSGQLLVNSC